MTTVQVRDARPADYEGLRRLISAEYDGLSKQLRHIARYALDNPNEIAVETIAVIADRAKVQPSSLIRFAKALGFDGYTEMQRLFQQRLVATRPSYNDRIRSLRQEMSQADDYRPMSVLSRFAAANIVALEHLQQEVSDRDLERAVDLLHDAEVIHFLAQRRAYPIASYLYYAINRLGRRTLLLDGVGGMLAEQQSLIGPSDVLVAVSFTRYSPQVVEVTADAHERGVPVLAITDRPLSPLTKLASVCFHVEDAAVHDFRSLGASMCLAQTLVVSLGTKLREGINGN